MDIAYIAFDCESIVERRFGCCPFDGKFRAFFGFVHTAGVLLR